MANVALHIKVQFKTFLLCSKCPSHGDRELQIQLLTEVQEHCIQQYLHQLMIAAPTPLHMCQSSQALFAQLSTLLKARPNNNAGFSYINISL